MVVLKNTLGNHDRIYHIYTDSSPRYMGGSAGLAFYNGKLIISIRYSSAIAIGGVPYFNFRFIYDNSTPYLNNSLCKIGWLNLPESDDIPVYIKTKDLDVLPNGEKTVFKGFEDSRLTVWNGELYAYGTQYTNEDPGGSIIKCYKLDDNLDTRDILYFPGQYRQGVVENEFTEKNWMAIPDHPMDFIYMIAYNHGGLIALKYSDISNPEMKEAGMTQYKGSTPLIRIDNGYACIIHESYRGDRGLMYTHMICFLDDNFNITKISDPFHFEQEGIEFCTGWCIDDQNNLYISYSTTDGTTNVMKTTFEHLNNTINGSSDYGVIKQDHINIAKQLFKDTPITSAQYYWKDWIQNRNRNSLYSHYTILLYYLDRYLLPDNLLDLEEDNSIDAIILKIYHLRRTSRDFRKFYDLLYGLPSGWVSKIQNEHIKYFQLEKLII